MRIFLATSFTSKVLPDGTVDPSYRAHIEAILTALETKDHQVKCGMREDGWRIKDHDPLAAFTYDVESINKAELLMVLIRYNPLSAGMQFELGYTFALNKNILLISQKDDKPIPFINLGLMQHAKVREITYDKLEDVPGLLKDI